MEIALIGIGGILLFVAFVTGIMIAVQMIKHDQQGLGIATIVLLFICGPIGNLIALIFGWMKASEWGIKNLVMAYTVSLVLGLLLFFPGYFMWGARIFKDAQQQMQQEGMDGMQDMQDFDFDNIGE